MKKLINTKLLNTFRWNFKNVSELYQHFVWFNFQKYWTIEKESLSFEFDKFYFHENWYRCNIFIHVSLRNKSKNWFFFAIGDLPFPTWLLLLNFEIFCLWSDFNEDWYNITSSYMHHYKTKGGFLPPLQKKFYSLSVVGKQT